MTDDDGSLVDYTSGGRVLPCCLSGHVLLWFSSLHTIPKPDDGDFFLLFLRSRALRSKGKLSERGGEELGQWKVNVCSGFTGGWWVLKPFSWKEGSCSLYHRRSRHRSNEGERSASLFDSASLFAWYFAISFFLATHWTSSLNFFLPFSLLTPKKISNN